MFSKQTQYALRAIIYLALNASPSHKIGVNVVAEELDVPKQFLSKILQKLVIKNLLHSSKGKSGGFYLTKANLNSNLRLIIETFDGDDLFCSCVMGLPKCSSENPCPLHEPSIEYRNQLLTRLDNQNIRDLATSVAKEGFTI
jgi:Rrf2 family protein